MGISTSASLLVIFFGAVIALGAVYTVGSNTTGDLADAYGEVLSAQTAVQETEVDLEAVYHEPDGALTLRVDNAGTGLSVGATTVLVDGEYRSLSAFETVTVEDRETDVWGRGEQLRLERETDEPARVKVVTEHAVAETATVVVADIEHSNPRTVDGTGDGTDSTIAFDLTSSYDDNVTVLDVTVEAVENADAEEISYEDGNLPEVEVTRVADGEVVATADGSFAVGETVDHDGFALGGDVEYRIGAFRDGDGDPVAMPDTTVTVTLTYEDPAGVERTETFTEEGF